ncbi:MAG: SOS response-associated peptidase family protein [Burkholderiales bacterium]
MCTRYVSPEDAAIERVWHIGARNIWRMREVFPRQPGAFVRTARESTERELVVGTWGLIPWFAKTPTLTYATCNARSEELADKASYKHPWARGQRCIIAAESFFEPNWESGKHIPWRFRRADGELWGLAGLWNTWTDKESGEIHESYTMLTINADSHPLMNRMHRPDPKRPPEMQDKRSVVPVALTDVDTWLNGTVEEAKALVQLPAVELFNAEPA